MIYFKISIDLVEGLYPAANFIYNDYEYHKYSNKEYNFHLNFSKDILTDENKCVSISKEEYYEFEQKFLNLRILK